MSIKKKCKKIIYYNFNDCANNQENETLLSKKACIFDKFVSFRSLILDFHVHVKVSSRLNGLNSEAFVLNTFLSLTCVRLSCTNKLWCFSSFDTLRRDLQRQKHPDFIEIFFYPFVPLIKLSFESLLMIC